MVNSDKNHNPKPKRTSMSSKIQQKTTVKRRENTAFITMHGQTHMRQQVYGVCVLRAPQQLERSPPERHAHCGVLDDGVPVLQVEPIPASSGNSNRTTTRSSPHARIPGIVDTSKNQKRKFGQKGRLTKEKREGTFFFITGIFPARNWFLLQLKINSRKTPPGEITGVTVSS